MFASFTQYPGRVWRSIECASLLPRIIYYDNLFFKDLRLRDSCNS